MKRFQVKDYKVEEVKWLKKDGSVKSRCCKECGSDYLTEQDIREEISSRYKQIAKLINTDNESWAVDEMIAHTNMLYKSLMAQIGR